jgi:hypothetical protein
VLIEGAHVQVLEMAIVAEPGFEGGGRDAERQRIRYERHENMVCVLLLLLLLRLSFFFFFFFFFFLFFFLLSSSIHLQVSKKTCKKL